MARLTLDRELLMLKDEVLMLGSMVEQAMLSARDALAKRDIEAAAQIERADDAINEKRYAIENHVIIVIATQQPLAHDLRFLTAILEIITELERMGDYAKSVAKITSNISTSPAYIPIQQISRGVNMAVTMLDQALQAFIYEDVAKAYAIAKEDRKIDELYNQIYRDLIKNMIANPGDVDFENLIMWVIHDIERFADRVTNICERTVFIATGEIIEMSSSLDEWEEEEDEPVLNKEEQAPEEGEQGSAS